MYRKGNGFKEHVDTPKAGLVGTVVLLGWGCAKSWGGHGSGGDLVVHVERIPVGLQMTMVVFSSAAPHRVEPIKAGTRVSLVWELFFGSHPEDATRLWPSKGSRKDVDTAEALLKLEKTRIKETVAKEARPLRKIPNANHVLMLPLSEACTSDTICQAIRNSTGRAVDLQESLIGTDKTVAQPFLDDKNLVCSVSPVVIVAMQEDADGLDSVEPYKEHYVDLICASSMLYERNSVFQRLVSCGKRVKWVFPAWTSVRQWAQGFLVVGKISEGFCGHTGNEISQVASIRNQAYFRLVLCVMHKNSPLLTEL